MFYFIGYRLKGSDEASVENLRQRIAQEFDVYAALKIPPHFTLFYPFELGDASDVERALVGFAARQEPFTVASEKFASFEPAVWFIEVERGGKAQALRDNLKSLLGDLGVTEDTKYPEPFHFHITVAYKDLAPDKFAQIGAWLDGRAAPIKKLEIDSITLFEKHDDRWLALRDFSFNQ